MCRVSIVAFELEYVAGNSNGRVRVVTSRDADVYMFLACSRLCIATHGVVRKLFCGIAF